MKVLLFIFLSFITLFKCQHLRRLKLTRNETNYKVLCEVAKKTVYQLYNKTIDFRDREDAYVVDTGKLTIKVVIDEYAELPKHGNQTTFNITNGRPIIPDLEIPQDISFDVYGAKDLKEEFRIFSRMIAAGYSGYENGNVTIYRKETEYTGQGRFICFVRGKNKEEYGAFEVLQQDENDKKDLMSKITNFLKKVKEKLQKITGAVRVVSEIIGTFKGIIKDLKGASSYIRFSYLTLLMGFILF